MRKLLFAALLAAGFGLGNSNANAQFGSGPLMPAGHEMIIPGSAPAPAPAAADCGKFGWNPMFKKLFWWKKDSDCGDCGKGRMVVPPPPGAPGGPMVGTLVYPNHPFVRSPRDFFMYGQGGR